MNFNTNVLYSSIAVYLCLSESAMFSFIRPGQFPVIAGNAENHGNDREFHESHKILNQI